jgi:hypothetical protein
VRAAKSALLRKVITQKSRFVLSHESPKSLTLSDREQICPESLNQ